MIRTAWLVLFCFFGAIASAERFPALFDVSGVPSNDVLNIRSGPSSDYVTIGQFFPDETDIEIIKLNRSKRWGMVNIREGIGWVSMAFLQRQPDQNQGDIPKIKSCHGNEPFWNLAIHGTSTQTPAVENKAGTSVPKMHSPLGFRFQLMGSSKFGVSKWEAFRSANRTDEFAIHAENFVAILVNQTCNDGMSDFEFGWRTTVFFEQPTGDLLLSGCCSLK